MSDPVSQLNDALEGRYRIQRELGRGGMATVYLADDLRHERKVALKVLRPNLAAVVGADRFLAEIKTTANLQHPHILPLFDSGQADGFLFYVMPYVEGESLRARLDRERQLPVDEAVQIAIDVAGALDYAHRRGVVHRDIKPANVLLLDGRPVIADFGIAIAVSSGGGDRLTETGLSLGTPYYMSPEQATGDQHVGPAADVYALGCVLYEMLIGEPPFAGSSPQAVLGRALTEDAPCASTTRRTVPTNVSDAISKALEKLPADRFESAAAMAHALVDPTFNFAPTRRHARARGPRARGQGAPRRTLPVAVAASTVALGVLAAWGWLRPTSSGEAPRASHAIVLGSMQAELDTGIVRGLALSPDGRAMVFPDTTGGVDRLWIKVRERHAAEPLAGTEGGRAPFFSPDGQWIAFFNEIGLRKVPVTGGTPITITEVPLVRHPAGAWGEDGKIVFLGSGISLVDEDGGEPEIVVPLTGALGGAYRSLAMLPGGRGFLYGACATDCTGPSVWVQAFDGSEPRLLLRDASRAWYLPEGLLMYVTPEGSAFTQSFDATSHSLTGTPEPLLDGIRVSRRSLTSLLPEIAVSASGTIVYQAGTSDRTLHQVAWVDRTGASIPVDPNWTLEPPGTEGIDLSPDGQRLAITVNGIGGTSDEIAIKAMPDGPVSRVNAGPWNYRPSWSSDGSTLTFISTGTNRSAQSLSALFEHRVDGAGPPSVVAEIPNRTIEEGIWSPDGQWLLLRLGGLPWDLDRDLVALRAGSDELTDVAVVAGSQQRDASISPNGRWVAYRSNESGQYEIYVRSFPGDAGGRIQVSLAGGAQARPRWSDDGRELFYVDPDGLVALSVDSEDRFVVRERERLFDLRGRFSAWFDVTPDGRFIMVESRHIPGTTSELVLVENIFAGVAGAPDRR